MFRLNEENDQPPQDAAGTQSLTTISLPLRPAAVDICSPN